MKLQVSVAKATQTGVEELGTKDKTLYYLIIGEGDVRKVINVGEKTYHEVSVLIARAEQQAAGIDTKKPDTKR